MELIRDAYFSPHAVPQHARKLKNAIKQIQ